MDNTELEAPADAETAALEYARQGLRVVPIAPGTKHPRGMGRWQDKATTDPNQIRLWYQGLYRGHGVGIATGRKSGIWALDIDVSGTKTGDQTLRDLTAKYGPLPRAPLAQTGTGGYHMIFAWDENRPVANIQNAERRLGPGLDVRGEGGQIVAAPTIHPNGNPYKWLISLLEGRPAGPDWLYDLMAPAVIPKPATTIGPDQIGNQPADLAPRFFDYADLLTDDGWHHLGNELWVRPDKNPTEGHSAVLHDEPHGPLVIFSTEAPAELFEVGHEADGGNGWVVTLFDYLTATRYGCDPSRAARALTAKQWDVWRPTNAPTAAPATPDTPNDNPDNPDNPEPATNKPDETTTRFDLLDIPAVLALQPPEPLAHGWVYRSTLAVLYGAPKSGKSFVALDLALAMATGTNWVGGTTETGTVIYCAGEGLAGMGRRIGAWSTARGTDLGNAQFRAVNGGPQLGDPDAVGAFVHEIGDLKPDLVVFDTLARASLGLDENSAQEMGRVVASADYIKDTLGACVLLVHHTGKDAERGIRGSSALTGAIDTGISVKGDPKAMTVETTQQKDAEPAPPLQLVGVAHDDSIALSVATFGTGGMSKAEQLEQDKMAAAKTKVARAVRGMKPAGGSVREIAERVGGRQSRQAVLLMIDDGALMRVGGTDKQPVYGPNRTHHLFG